MIDACSCLWSLKVKFVRTSIATRSISADLGKNLYGLEQGDSLPNDVSVSSQTGVSPAAGHLCFWSSCHELAAG